jgi:hypothetical protein
MVAEQAATAPHRKARIAKRINGMQPSSVMAMRVLVTLACMIVVPLLAIFGTSWVTLGSTSTRASSGRLQSSDFGHSSPGRNDSMAGTWMTPPAATGNAPEEQSMQPMAEAPVGAASMAPTAIAPPPLPLAPAGFNPSADAPGPELAALAEKWSAPVAADSIAATAGGLQSDPANSVTKRVDGAPVRMGSRGIPSRRRGVLPSTNAAADPVSPAPIAAAAGTSLPAAQGLMTNDWFAAIQQRLRELGATYYLLETLGTGGIQYRFHCKMAVAGNPNNTRQFEATDADPARAMQTVLRDVETWRR